LRRQFRVRVAQRFEFAFQFGDAHIFIVISALDSEPCYLIFEFRYLPVKFVGFKTKGLVLRLKLCDPLGERLDVRQLVRHRRRLLLPVCIDQVCLDGDRARESVAREDESERS
jgi:hypothetical protein